jgi:hypothetical protein
MYANTTGGNNTAVGMGALGANTSASNNTAVGYLAAGSNTTALNNTAIGQGALKTNATSENNTAVGSDALEFSTGGYNTGIGAFALNSLTTGTYNTAIGMGAADLITTGSNNTVVGTYNGNEGGLDIRTSSNYVVLSDGEGNPLFYIVPPSINAGINGSYFSAAQTLPSSTDLNSIRKPGMYRVDNNATNSPTSEFFALVVFGNNGNVTTQIATVIAGTTTYVRSFNASWTGWARLDT